MALKKVWAQQNIELFNIILFQGSCLWIEDKKASTLIGAKVLEVNKESVVIVQIEDAEALKNLDQILSVKGMDACIVGPYDLSASLGVPGSFTHPKMTRALSKIMKAAKKASKKAGRKKTVKRNISSNFWEDSQISRKEKERNSFFCLNLN